MCRHVDVYRKGGVKVEIRLLECSQWCMVLVSNPCMLNQVDDARLDCLHNGVGECGMQNKMGKVRKGQILIDNDPSLLSAQVHPALPV